ncbi:MAG: winged helix-turn-helix domain-containing protein [Thermoplasmata archaeon]
MFDIIRIISGRRYEILGLLRGELQPSEISLKLGITRQGVERHLNILNSYLLVNKLKRNGRVYYKLSVYGEFLFQTINDLNEKFITKIRDDYYSEKNRIYNLLINGEIDRDRYDSMVNELRSSYRKYFGLI